MYICISRAEHARGGGRLLGDVVGDGEIDAARLAHLLPVPLAHLWARLTINISVYFVILLRQYIRLSLSLLLSLSRLRVDKHHFVPSTLRLISSIFQLFR